MENYEEKRKYSRYPKNMSISLSTYESPDRYAMVRMYNYSCGGVYLQSREKIDVGKQVYIKIKSQGETSEETQRYRQYAGYVQWSEDLGTSSPGGPYGYGVEYTIPAAD